jgi:hypothetical protein
VVNFLVVVQICSFTPKAVDTSALSLCNLYCDTDLAGRISYLRQHTAIVLQPPWCHNAAVHSTIIKFSYIEHLIVFQQAGGYEQVDSWMSVLDRQQSDLMAELRAYREQHKGLVELVGSMGILQETLFRQKQELLQKFEVSSYVIKILKLLIRKTKMQDD